MKFAEFVAFASIGPLDKWSTLTLDFTAKVNKCANLDDTEMNFDTNDKKWQLDRDFS